MINMRLCAAGVAAAVALATGSASAATFYGVTNNGGLVQFDTTAQTATALSTIHVGATSPTGFEDLDFDSTGNLYAVRDFTDFNTFQQICDSYRITSVGTGASLLAATIANVGKPYTGLAATSSPGVFNTVNNINGFVGTLNIMTGAFVPTTGVANGPRNTVEALAVNPVSGQAYGLIDLGSPIVGTIDYTLINVNLSTGLSTVIGSLGGGNDSFKALRFDSTGVAYTVDMTNGNVDSVDLGTGHATVLFAGGAAAIGTTGLALVSVPTPGTFGLLALAGVACTRRRR